MNSFNTLAKTWDENPNRSKYTEAVGAYIKSNTSKEQRLQALEIGAGTGTLSVMLSDDFSRIDLLDSSEGMINEMARKLEENNLFHLTPVAKSIQHYNPLKLYDVVYSAMFLHHVKEVEGALKKISDMTQAGGKLFMCDLYTEDGRFHPSTVEGVYHYGFDPDSLANYMKTLGYTINNIETVYNFEKHDRLYPMFVVEATKNK